MDVLRKCAASVHLKATLFPNLAKRLDSGRERCLVKRQSSVSDSSSTPLSLFRGDTGTVAADTRRDAVK